VTPAVANKAVRRPRGASSTRPANTVFMQTSTRTSRASSSLASATYSYDATIALALAIDKGQGTTNGPAYAKDRFLVTSPPGTAVYDFQDGTGRPEGGPRR